METMASILGVIFKLYVVAIMAWLTAQDIIAHLKQKTFVKQLLHPHQLYAKRTQMSTKSIQPRQKDVTLSVPRQQQALYDYQHTPNYMKALLHQDRPTPMHLRLRPLLYRQPALYCLPTLIDLSRLERNNHPTLRL